MDDGTALRNLLDAVCVSWPRCVGVADLTHQSEFLPPPPPDTGSAVPSVVKSEKTFPPLRSLSSAGLCCRGGVGARLRHRRTSFPFSSRWIQTSIPHQWTHFLVSFLFQKQGWRTSISKTHCLNVFYSFNRCEGASPPVRYHHSWKRSWSSRGRSWAEGMIGCPADKGHRAR